MSYIYTNGEYLTHNPSWHVEDSLWKAEQVMEMIKQNQLHPNTIAELGCGAGIVLHELSKRMSNEKNISLKGYDISPQAIEIAKKVENERLSFVIEDLLTDQNKDFFDLLLVIDVIEHVPDYMGFLTKCQGKAQYKIYHIPLDIHVSSVLRNAFIRGRYTIGHLHYFTADSALAVLRDTSHEIVAYYYTNAALGLFRQHPSVKRAVANVPRWLFSKVNLSFTARVLGGYSLLVLAR